MFEFRQGRLLCRVIYYPFSLSPFFLLSLLFSVAPSRSQKKEKKNPSWRDFGGTCISSSSSFLALHILRTYGIFPKLAYERISPTTTIELKLAVANLMVLFTEYMYMCVSPYPVWMDAKLTLSLDRQQGKDEEEEAFSLLFFSLSRKLELVSQPSFRLWHWEEKKKKNVKSNFKVTWQLQRGCFFPSGGFLQTKLEQQAKKTHLTHDSADSCSSSSSTTTGLSN